MQPPRVRAGMPHRAPGVSPDASLVAPRNNRPVVDERAVGYRVISPEGLDALVAAFGRAATASSARRSRTARSSTASWRARASCPSGGPTVQDGRHVQARAPRRRARFGYAVGPHSWKQFLFPPRIRLWRARRNGDGPSTSSRSRRRARRSPSSAPAPASCTRSRSRTASSSAARFVDRDYAAPAGGAFVVAVNCGEPGGTCFCTSMGTGPRAESGYDLALTEMLDGAGHRLLVEVGTERGAEVLAELPSRAGRRRRRRRGRRASSTTRPRRMGRRVETGDIRDLLHANLDHPRWDDVAARCLSCTNCTLVCPTCFCSTVEDHTDLDGSAAERVTRLGLVLLARPLVHPRRQRPSERARRATGSG